MTRRAAVSSSRMAATATTLCLLLLAAADPVHPYSFFGTTTTSSAVAGSTDANGDATRKAFSSAPVAAVDAEAEAELRQHQQEETVFLPKTRRRNGVVPFLFSKSPESRTVRVSSSSFASSDRTYFDSPAARVAFLSDSSSMLSPFEVFCVSRIEDYYREAMAIKCPFFRRRASDFLDGADMIMRFLVVRHKSLDVLAPPPSWRCSGSTCRKIRNMPVEDIVDVIRADWKHNEGDKGYYITGKLNTTVYRDDCIFDGPDPDMPGAFRFFFVFMFRLPHYATHRRLIIRTSSFFTAVRGLRKYLNAASQLFDQRKSRSKLLALEVVKDDVIVARWRMNGILRLPWRPELPTWTGTTTYYRDSSGLIYKHEETWDMTVFQAFLRTFLPSLARRIWPSRREGEIGSPLLSPCDGGGCDVP